MSLTEKQKKVLDFIQSYTEREGFPPTHKVIMQYFGWKSPGSVQDYLGYLQEKGFLSREWHAKSSLVVLEQKNQIPLLGKVAAGRPLEHFTHNEKIEVPLAMVKKAGRYFALKIKGDSMIQEGILEGDTVIVRESDHAENGQIVVAFVNDGATIKKFYKKNQHIELHSANPKYQPILVKPNHTFRIEGLYCGLIRY